MALKSAMNEVPLKSERSGKSPDSTGVSKSHDSLSETNPSQPNEASHPHVFDRVSKINLQGRVLPSWTRKSRPPTLNEIPPTLFTTGRKRPTQSQVSNDSSELPPKRF